MLQKESAAPGDGGVIVYIKFIGKSLRCHRCFIEFITAWLNECVDMNIKDMNESLRSWLIKWAD
jgi:hypothetical protein